MGIIQIRVSGGIPSFSTSCRPLPKVLGFQIGGLLWIEIWEDPNIQLAHLKNRKIEW